MPSLLASSAGLYRSADGRSLIAGTPECVAACCGVAGFYRAVPCDPGVGCGGGEAGEPVWIPTDYTCAPDGSAPGGRSVIGFDRSCWFVDRERVWQLCPLGGALSPDRNCIPNGARVLAPGTPVACLNSCQASDCLNSAPRWITLNPCDPASWPPPGYPPETPLPIIPADGFTSGCLVGRAAGGDCWTADCANVFAGEPPPGTIIFGDGIDFAYDSCCQCGCDSGTVQLGCDDQYPPSTYSCCCPIELNEGATMTYNVTRVTVGTTPPGYRVRTTETWEGVYAIGPGGSFVGSGTYTNRLEYIGPACPGFPVCPPSGCIEEQTFPDFRAPQCPPPLAVARPCPGTPGTTWVGSRNCQGSYSRQVYINPNQPNCSAFGTASIITEGRFSLSGVDYRPCDNGCRENTNVLGGRREAVGFGLFEGLL